MGCCVAVGLVPVVATASFPLINLPKFYLSFTILVSLILVKYPDRVGLVNAVPALLIVDRTRPLRLGQRTELIHVGSAYSYGTF